MPTAGSLRYAIARREEVVGYWDAYRKRNRWNVRVNLQQEFWGSELERQAVVALTQEVVKASGERNSIPLALHVPSAAHHEALCAGSPSIAADFGMTEQRYDRMIMAKSLGTEP